MIEGLTESKSETVKNGEASADVMFTGDSTLGTVEQWGNRDSADFRIFSCCH